MKLVIVALALLVVVVADVSELGAPSADYLPPAADIGAPIEAPTQEYLPPADNLGPAPLPLEPEPAHTLSDDGYRYKKVRRVRYRFRH